jgi:hypothetical protein
MMYLGWIMLVALVTDDDPFSFTTTTIWAHELQWFTASTLQSMIPAMQMDVLAEHNRVAVTWHVIGQHRLFWYHLDRPFMKKLQWRCSSRRLGPKSRLRSRRLKKTPSEAASSPRPGARVMAALQRPTSVLVMERVPGAFEWFASVVGLQTPAPCQPSQMSTSLHHRLSWNLHPLISNDFELLSGYEPQSTSAVPALASLIVLRCIQGATQKSNDSDILVCHGFLADYHTCAAIQPISDLTHLNASLITSG